MDAAGDQQRVDASAGGASDVGAQAVADRENAAAFGDPQQLETAVIDRRVGLAVPAHSPTEPFVLFGERTGAQRRSAVVDYDEVGVGAYHRQIALARGGEDRRAIRDRVLPLGRTGI